MEIYLNKSGNSPITYYQIADTFITIWFGTKSYKYSYGGRAGKMHVDNMKGLARSGSGLSAYITRNVRNNYD